MDFFSVGQHAEGFIAFGQHATGFIAVGQMATGFIAIGQLSRGVVAIGQLACGLIGWGQVGAGILHAVGMLGVGGRGMGVVLRLVPSIGRARVEPDGTTIAKVQEGESGWLLADLMHDDWGIGLYDGGARLPIKLDCRIVASSTRLAKEQKGRIWAFTRRIGSTLVCERIAHVPPRPYKKPSFLPIAVFQLAALTGLGIGYWAAVGNDLVDFTFKAIAEETVDTPKPPASAPRPVPPRKR